MGNGVSTGSQRVAGAALPILAREADAQWLEQFLDQLRLVPRDDYDSAIGRKRSRRRNHLLHQCQASGAMQHFCTLGAHPRSQSSGQDDDRMIHFLFDFLL
jgi:hypothetical protein